MSEASLAFLQGAVNNGTGRNWKAYVALGSQLIGAMRSISSHWKRDFDEQEPDLESEILALAEHGLDEPTTLSLSMAARHASGK